MDPVHIPPRVILDAMLNTLYSSQKLCTTPSLQETLV